MSSAPGASAIELWCGGARRAGSRALTEVERAWIRRLRSHHGRRAIAGLAIIPLALGVPLAILNAWRLPPGDTFTIVMGVWGFLTFLLGLPVAILFVSEHGRAALDLSADLRAGEAWTFEPPAHATVPIEADETAPEDEGAAAPWPGPFALLPRSRRKLDVSRPAKETAREELLEVEPHGGTEFYAPLSLRVAAPSPDVRFAQRPLSPVERRELERVRRALFWPRLSTTLAFFVLIVMLGFGRYLAQVEGASRTPGWGDLVSLLLAVLICVRALMRYTRSVLLAGRLSRDLATGLVVRVEESGSPLTEMLPFSQLFWRIAGAPAGWRDRRRAAETLRASL